jgi:hypothetical protein
MSQSTCNLPRKKHLTNRPRSIIRLSVPRFEPSGLPFTAPSSSRTESSPFSIAIDRLTLNTYTSRSQETCCTHNSLTLWLVSHTLNQSTGHLINSRSSLTHGHISTMCSQKGMHGKVFQRQAHICVRLSNIIHNTL